VAQQKGMLHMVHGVLARGFGQVERDARAACASLASSNIAAA